MYLNKDDSAAFRYIYLQSYISYISIPSPSNSSIGKKEFFNKVIAFHIGSDFLFVCMNTQALKLITFHIISFSLTFFEIAFSTTVYLSRLWLISL